MDLTITPGNATLLYCIHFEVVFIFYFIVMKVEEEKAGVGKLDADNYRRRCQDQEGKVTLRT